MSDKMDLYVQKLNELLEARELIVKLICQLDEAKNVIRNNYKLTDRNDVTWKIYDTRSPEMQRINETLNEGKKYITQYIEG